jgi:hypothetical protein
LPSYWGFVSQTSTTPKEDAIDAYLLDEDEILAEKLAANDSGKKNDL